MEFINSIKTFANDEDGAFTFDWMLLTAATLGLSLAVLLSVASGTSNPTGEVSVHMSGTNAVQNFH